MTLVGAVLTWAVRKFLPGKVEKTQLTDQPIRITIDKALEEKLDEKFMTKTECGLMTRSINGRVDMLEHRHTALETKIETMKDSLSREGSARASLIFKKIDENAHITESKINEVLRAVGRLEGKLE